VLRMYFTPFMTARMSVRRLPQTYIVAYCIDLS
jgi:hypothetical protein